MSPANDPARPTAPGAPMVELQRSAHEVLGFHLAPECVAGVAKCLDDLTAHIERVRAFAGAASRHEAAGSDGAGAGALNTDATATHAVAPDAVADEAAAVRATPPWPSLLEIANAVRTGSRTAESVTVDALHRIAQLNPQLRAVTRTLTDRALRRARFVDSQVARGIDPGT